MSLYSFKHSPLRRAGLRRVAMLLAVVAIVQSHRVAAQPSPPRARLTEDLRLDATKEDFPTISSIYVGPRGQIAIPVRQDMHLRLYDANGRRVATVGRKGGGPGEFTAFHYVGWLGDTMWINDASQKRFTYVAPDGKVFRTTVYPVVNGMSVSYGTPAVAANINRFSPIGLENDGSMAGEAYVAIPGVVATRRMGVSALIRVPGGKAPQMLFVPTTISDTDERFWMWASGFGNPIPFITTPQIDVTPNVDRFAKLVSLQTSAAGGTISVSLQRTNGDTVFAKSFPYRGVSISKQVRDSVIDAIMKDEKQTEGPADLRQQLQAIARKKTPAQYAGAESINLGLDNTVWIGLRRTAEGQPMLVLNGKGEPIATVIIPKNSQLRQASATQLYVTEKDDDGLVSVVRYRITGIPVQPLFR